MESGEDGHAAAPSCALLVQALTRLAGLPDHAALMVALLQTARQVAGAHGVAIVYHGSGDCFYSHDGESAIAGQQARRWPLMTAAADWAVRRREMAVIDDLEHDQRIAPAARRSPLVRSMVMVPLGPATFEHTPLSGMAVLWQVRRMPPPSELAAIEALAHIAALVMAHHDASTRLRASEARARDSAQHYRALVMASSHALFCMDAAMSDMRVIEGRGNNILDACAGGNWLDTLVCPDDRARVAEACMRAVQQRAILEVEHRVRQPGAAWGWVALRAVPVADADGTVDEWLGMATDITERKQTEETLWRRANFDTLTGLPNRRLFRDRLDHEIRKVQRSARTLALLFIDLDRFKEVNDLLGHAVGDRLLVEAAQRIHACVRQSDTVARLGGDEFTAILTNLDELSHVENTAQKIIDALVRPFYFNDEQIYLSASVGITLFETDADNAEDLIRNADQAMYAAKNAGRNQFSYFTPGMQQRAHQRLRLIADLRNALHNGQLEVHFQPVVSLSSGSVGKAEALLRWRHPRHGLIEPTLFIPYAEESGLINEIGDWVFEQAANCSLRWSQALGRPFQIGVNRSPVQFRASPAQLNWSTYLRRLGLPGNSITVEITEGVLLHASASVTDSLVAYRDAGIEVAIDDFGSGYSSMAYLKKFNIDYLKIDQSFIHDMAVNPADRAIVKAMIVMAHELDLRVVAEGIETAEQQRLLVAAGCDFGQGFLFARAMPAGEFESQLQLRR